MHQDTVKVMNWINDVRNSLGIIPITTMPKGFPTDENNCPIALAFTWSADGKMTTGAAEVGAEHFEVYDPYDRERIFAVGDLPQYVKTWIEDFDEGKYQEYIFDYEDDGQ